MNTYLIMLAGQVEKIRKIMDWTQADLCAAIGISRPVLSKIENDPTKLSKTVALALFTALFGELEKRRLHLMTAVEQTDWSTQKTFQESLKYKSWVNKDLNALMKEALTPALANPLLFQIMLPFVLAKTLKEVSKRQSIQVSKEELFEVVAQAIAEKEAGLLKCFGLQKSDMYQFLSLIEAGEIDVDEIDADEIDTDAEGEQATGKQNI